MEQKGFKAEIIKRPSSTSKCFCLSHSRASRFQKFFLSVNYGDLQYFSVSHGPSTLKSILPALFRNYKYIPWKLVQLAQFQFSSEACDSAKIRLIIEKSEQNPCN